MNSSIRKIFNAAFTEEKYQSYLALLQKAQGSPLQFRIAETPIFLDKDFTKKLIEAGNLICSQLVDKAFIAKTDDSIPSYAITKNESLLPNCLVIDFAIAYDPIKQVVPKLIELQGFPSLFGFEVLQDEALRKVFNIPNNYTPFLNNYHYKTYIEHFKKILYGEHQKKCILLEIKPEQQKTKIDFYYTQALTGIPIVCISEIYQKNEALYYKKEGIEYKVERIYNRMVFEELLQQEPGILEKWELIRNADNIEWVTHPHHFFRFSKYSLPFLKGDAVPTTQFLDKLTQIPSQLDQYILKPLFSFAGQGVIIDITEEIMQNIKDPQNWIIQEKVDYAPVIDTPTGPTKAEIRLFYFWDETQHAYTATMNLARLSKGKMIGVNYNKAATWVGGSLAYVES